MLDFKEKEDTKQIGVTLPESLYSKLQTLSKFYHVPVSSIAREILKKYTDDVINETAEGLE